MLPFKDENAIIEGFSKKGAAEILLPDYTRNQGSGAWIRTREMSVPKTDALPLGYARTQLRNGSFHFLNST